MNLHAVKSLSAEQLRAFFDSNMIGLLFWDMSGQITEANDYVLHLTGYSREELYAGQIRWDLMTPLEFMDRERQAHEQLAAHGVCEPFEKEYIRKDSRRVPVLVGGAYLGNDGMGGVSFVIDRSKQAATGQETHDLLEEAATRYRTMFEQAPVAIATYSTSGKTLTANRSWFELWGVDESMLETLNIRTNEEVHRTGFNRYFDKAFAGESVVVPPMHYIPPEGYPGRPVWVENWLFPIKDIFGNVREVVATSRDVTPQKDATMKLAAAAKENARLYAEAREALAARDEFLSIASHELKTPLTSLHMAVQILKETSRGSSIEVSREQMDQLIVTCERQSRRLTTLVNELLDLTRVRSGRFELKHSYFDLAELTSDVLSKMAAAEHKRPEFTIHAAARGIWGRWDRSRFEQVITNLLSNAFRYGRGQPIHVKLWQDAESTYLTVADQGIGIAPEDRDRIFKRFERSPSTRNIGGLGLGLYIVRKIVEAHQGKIRVESEPGKGSTFTIEVPT